MRFSRARTASTPSSVSITCAGDGIVLEDQLDQPHAGIAAADRLPPLVALSQVLIEKAGGPGLNSTDPTIVASTFSPRVVVRISVI